MDAGERFSNERAVHALMDAGNYKGAEARLKQMLASFPDDARAHALMGFCKLAQDQNKPALEAARAGAALDPDDWLVRQVLSQALLRNKKFKEAEGIAQRLAAEDPEDSAALFKLGIARWANKDYHGANDLFDKAEAHADSAGALLNIAHMKLREWRYGEASALARRALELDPARSDVFFILGECALAEGRVDEAYDLSLEALRLDPGDKEVLRLLSRAHARRDTWLKPFLPGVDWMVEMDRPGLFIVGGVLGVLSLLLLYNAFRDIARALLGLPPVIVISVALLAAVVYGGICYATAIGARMRIRRDLKRIALPKF